MTVSTSPWPAGVPGWADLTVTELGPTQRFYGGLLGWQLSIGGPETGGYVTATVDGHVVAGIKVADVPRPAGWCVYLATDDLVQSVERAVAAGATVVLDPVTELDLGRLAVLCDPTGAVVGLWEAGTRTGWQVTDVPGTFVWAEQMSQDPDGARRFYTELFGYEQQDMSAPDFTYTSLSVGGAPAMGVGGYGPGAGDVPAAWTWYVAVEDADAIAPRVAELGGEVVSGPENTPYGRMLLVRGPAGEVLALLQAPPEDLVA
ncbi:VOC family protein [Cellulomonas sp. zg-ZUI222]|uniref:VOC family protein n=1 Tax=Cellulomonas wangleii TaxID=2816956 RepID=A0ABX8D614_9CELL|nr:MULTISPECIES: VOC family protein [Cellulomonas]MBO0901425.1 VOC family protein [Cellulomonas sp. zg-ZUI22]MBO0921871.1 VOC family protein [Cellulomonas wangleii]MBO0924707.1 VOC family protein [Cellulomonas wangleii]QVI62894.1 VOC family protein [Cellulomonas wangleii]